MVVLHLFVEASPKDSGDREMTLLDEKSAQSDCKGIGRGTMVVISANKIPPQAPLLSVIQRPSRWGKPVHAHPFPVKELWEAK